ncbi:hypothetical protein, partial [Vibrio sp. 03_296]|uniref:hypothetical protein n=1 Tax=Vibrio sp. 03_296 TaxID=2024409 RepID=UPI001595E556
MIILRAMLASVLSILLIACGPEVVTIKIRRHPSLERLYGQEWKPLTRGTMMGPVKPSLWLIL